MRHSYLLVLSFLLLGLYSASASATPVTCDAKSEATSVLKEFAAKTGSTDGIPQIIDRLGVYFKDRLEAERQALKLGGTYHDVRLNTDRKFVLVTKPDELLQNTKVAACVIAVIKKSDPRTDLLKASANFVSYINSELTEIIVRSPRNETENNRWFFERGFVEIYYENIETMAQILDLRERFGRGL